MKLDETKIQFYLNRYVMAKGHYIAIPNVSWSWLYWEADLISITKSFYMYEYEIKISRADFEKDFVKPKHRRLKRCAKGQRIPNYFVYVAPIKAIPLCIPSYAGLIEVRQDTRYRHRINFIEIKKPEKIHGIKQDLKSINTMLRTVTFKYWDLAQTLDNIKIQKELFN